jgi:hypothetical protein
MHPLSLWFMDGTSLELYNSINDEGVINYEDQSYTFRGRYPVGEAVWKKIRRTDLDRIRITWGSGYEEYDIQYVHLLRTALALLRIMAIKIQNNVSLLPYNTFGIDVKAAHFTAVHSEADMREALQSGIDPVLVLGGGSNVLFTRDVSGLVIKNDISHIGVVRAFRNRAWIDAGAGVQWHDLVTWACSQNNLGGLGNMSLIPGTVGAAPVQNIGAYGVELKDAFVSLKAMETATGRTRTFSLKECAFGYRARQCFQTGA